MSEFRWLLLAAGILILAIVFWLSRRESSGKPVISPGLLRRRAPVLEQLPDDALVAAAHRQGTGARQADVPHRIVTVRLMGQGSSTFAGESLVMALREGGLRHGKFGIFHRHDAKDESRVLFSVASLVEPGSFDLTRLKTERFPGVSIFLALSGQTDCVTAFDDMMATAHLLAGKLGGELLDEKGSRLSVQRERYLREEVIQFQHKAKAP